VLQALYPIDHHARHGRPETAQKKVMLRLHAQDVAEVAAALEAAGFAVLESTETVHPALAA